MGGRVPLQFKFIVCQNKQVAHSSRRVSETMRNGNGKIITRCSNGKKISLEKLSNDIISSRIRDLSEDILQQVIENIKASATKVSLQLDESTDVSLHSQLLVLARHVKKKKWWKSFYFVNH